MNVNSSCSYFGYSRSAYYLWVSSKLQEQTKYDILLELVRYHRRIHPKIGTRKLQELIKEDVTKLKIKLGRDKLFELLRSEGLLVLRKRKYVVTTKSFLRYSKFEDHFNGKTWDSAHQAWVSDITYIRVGDSFRYLNLITDAYSRKIVGWHLGNTLETVHAMEALKMAINQCPSTKGLVHHSDRGFQYCSKLYTSALDKSGIKSSMGEVGNCYDNAMAERVNGILKVEYGLEDHFKNLKDAFSAVKHAIWAYNEKRPHMALNMKKPTEVHQALHMFSPLKRKISTCKKPIKAK